MANNASLSNISSIYDGATGVGQLAMMLAGATPEPTTMVALGAVGVLAQGISAYFGGKEQKRILDKKRKDLGEAADRTSSQATANQMRLERQADAQYRTQRALGDETARDVYGARVRQGIEMKSAADRYVADLRQKRAETPSMSNRDIWKNVVASAGMRAVQEGAKIVTTEAINKAIEKSNRVVPATRTPGGGNPLRFDMRTYLNANNPNLKGPNLFQNLLTWKQRGRQSLTL